MFCGILPWTWFSSSLLESSNVLIAGGNLIRKVLFPAEVLPIVTVLAHWCTSASGCRSWRSLSTIGVPVPLPIWRGLVPAHRARAAAADARPGAALSALTVHFRDLRDLLANLLTLWFFATPIIYPISQAPAGRRRCSTSTRSRTWPSPIRKCCSAGAVRPLAAAAGLCGRRSVACSCSATSCSIGCATRFAEEV